MKKKFKILSYGLLLLVIICSCKKDKEKENPEPIITVTDIDGNVYHTVTIGTQVWMVENLNVTHYRNGDILPNANDIVYPDSIGGCCDYGKIVSNGVIYGKLYNYYAIVDSRGLTPIGWHVPTWDEYNTLREYLGGHEVAGGKLKETGTSHWITPNTGATNETKFTALPGGCLSGKDNFLYIGEQGYWWLFTDPYCGGGGGTTIKMSYNTNMATPFPSYKSAGYSIRCIKD